MPQKAHGIVTRIGVDTVDARSSVNQLKRAIQQANHSFRDVANAQRAAGDSLGAMKTENDGLKDRVDSVRYSIGELNKALQRGRKEQLTGTNDFRNTEIDRQKMLVWLKSAKNSLDRSNRAMHFHNQELRESIENERHNTQVGQAMEAQYRAEGDAVSANNQRMTDRKQRIKDLTNEIVNYTHTMHTANLDQSIGTDNIEANRTREHLQEAIAERSELRREIALDDSKLKELEHDESTEQARHQSLLQQLRAEHNSVSANNLIIQDRIGKMNQLYRIQKEVTAEIRKASEGDNNYGGTAHVEHLKQKLYKLKGAAASTKSELNDMGKGIPTLTTYNDYYNQSVNKVVQRLKSLKGAAQAGREQFRMLSRNIVNEKRGLTAEQQKLSEVARANRTASDTTGHLSIAYQRQQSKVEGLNNVYARHIRRLSDLTRGYGSMSEKGAASIDKMTGKITDNDHAAHRYLRTAHQLVNGSIALGAGFLYGAKQATTLQHEFNKISVLAKNSSDEAASSVDRNVSGMKRGAVDLSETYGVSQQKISNGFEELIRRGYSTGQAMHSMKYYLQASTASGEDLGDVIESAGSALEGFGLKSGNIGKHTKVVTNEMAAGADYTASSFKDMAYSMSYVGPIAHQTNQSVSETSAALGELANNGIKGSMAGTSLRKVLQNIAGFKPSNKVLKSLGLTPKDFQDSKGNLLDISTIMGKLHDKMKHMSGAKQTNIMQQLFGRTGSQAAQVLTNNANAIGSLDKRISHATKNGYTSRTSHQNMRSAEGQLLRLKAAGTQLSREYAEGLIPVFSKTADVAITLASGLNHLPSGLKSTVAIATLAIPAFAGISYALATVKKATSVYLDLKKHGLEWFYKSDDELKLNSGYYEKHTSQLNTDTEALRSNNKQIQQAIALNGRLNGKLDQSATSQRTNADATSNDSTAKQSNSQANTENAESEADDAKTTDADTGAEKDNAEMSAVDGRSKQVSGSSGAGVTPSVSRSIKTSRPGIARTISRVPYKGSIGMGALVGGTEALSGNPKKGLVDGVGTTGGAIAGSALGPIGEMAGSVAGPIIADKITGALSKTYRQSKHRAENNPSGGDTDEDAIRNSKKLVPSVDEALKGMGRVTRNYVKNTASDERRAENNYVMHRGKMTQAQKNYYSDMVHNASKYVNSEKASDKSWLQSRLHTKDKRLKISKSEYNAELKANNRAYNKKLGYVKKAEKNLVKQSTKGGEARKKAMDRFNKDLMKLTTTSNKKQLGLRRWLNDHQGSLDEKTYKKIISEARNNYHQSVRSAHLSYKAKEDANVKSYHSQLQHIASMKGLSASKRKSDIDEATKSFHGTRTQLQNQETSAIDKARRQKNGVLKQTEDQKSSVISDFQNMANHVEGFFSGLGRWAKKIGGNNGKPVDPNTLWTGTADTQALHFADGQLPGLSRNENAVVNDGDGRELIKLPNGQLVYPSGRNVHTVLPKGTSVFNAMQSRQLLGQAVHHAGGTVGETALAGGTRGKSSVINVKTPSGSLAKTEKSTKKSMKNIHDVLDKGYKKTAKDVQGHLDDLHDKNDDSWTDNRKITKHHVTKLHDDTLDRYTDMKDSISDLQKRSNQLTGTHLDTTVSYFRHHFSMIPPISRSSMRSGVSNINSGISAIDKVLSQFGGNSRVLGAVHYATGTSGPSMNKQLAILNDATSGPMQEAVVSDQGRVRMPHGRNVPTMLNPGDKVLNGSDTLRALRTGLIPHYAKGLKSNDALKNLAKKYSKASTSFTNDTFNKLATTVGSLLARDTTVDAKNGSQKPANNWSNAMWKYIDSLINPDNSILVQKMHELGDGKPYKWGANGPNAYDCGGLVWRALQDLKISAPRTHMVNAFPKIPRSEAEPGDIVESDTHLGVVDSPGARSYFSAFSPNAHPNILSQPLDNAHFTPGHPFYFLRVPQLSKFNNEAQEVKRNPLTPLVKKQLGTKASGWVTKTLGDAGMNNPGGSGVSRWRYAVAQALRKNGFDATSSQIASWMQVINRETGGTGNPHLTNHWDSNAAAGHPSMGLVQTIGPTFNSNKFPNHGNIFNGYDDLLAGIHYAAATYGRGPGMFSRVATAGYHDGGLSVGDKMARISEGNKPEMVLPLTNKSRAVELMLKSLEYMFGNRQNQNQNQQTNHESTDSTAESVRDRQFEQELIQSNRNKDKMISNMLNKITVLIKVVQNKPVLSTADIYKANRHETQKKARLRNFNLGTF